MRYFILLSIPFFLNDLLNIYFHDNYRIWLGLEYTAKTWVLGYSAYLLWKNKISQTDYGLKKIPFSSMIIWTISLTIAGILLSQYGSRYWASVLPRTNLGRYPIIEDSFLYKFDLKYFRQASNKQYFRVRE